MVLLISNDLDGHEPLASYVAEGRRACGVEHPPLTDDNRAVADRVEAKVTECALTGLTAQARRGAR